MGTGYTRQSAASIATSEDITAAPLNAEFNQLQSAFDSSSGHSHDGTSGEGPLIDLTTSITGILPVARGGFAAIHKIDGTTAPTAGDDSGDGYGPGSIWVDVTNDVSYICLDASSGTAVWRQISFESVLADIEDLTPTDGAVIIGDGSNFVTESGGTLRTSLGLAIGSDVQAYDAGLDDISGLAVTDGNIIVGDGANWVAESGGTARTSLGLAIGSDVQAHGDVLDDLNTLGAASSDGEFLVATGAGVFTYESGATARASLGLTIGTHVQAYDAELAAIAGLTSASNKIIRFTGSGTAGLLDFADEDNMASDSATAIPSQQSVKAYVDAQVGGVAFNLGQIGDVTITSVSTGELLAYTGSGWENQTKAELDLITGADFSSDGEILVGTGSGTYTAESGATLRTSIGVSTAATYAEASANEYRAATADKLLVSDTVWSAMAEVSLSSSSNAVAWDMSDGIDFVIDTLGENTTIGAPTNTTVGKKGRLRIVQDGTGSRTVAWNAVFEFAGGSAPTATTDADAEDIFYYDVITSSRILVTAVLDIS